MEQSTAEAYTSSAGHQILNIHDSVQNSPPFVPLLSPIYPVPLFCPISLRSIVIQTNSPKLQFVVAIPPHHI